MTEAARVFIETERLRLRDWMDADAAPFAAMNTDPRVMEFFAGTLSRAESDALLADSREFLAAQGYGRFAVEAKNTSEFIGFCGLAPVGFPASFAPAMEIGWRLAREAWGSGYATEAARAVVADAFTRVGLDALVSFTAEWNRRSRAVMEKIGMTHDASADFLHTKLPPDHKLARQVLYRLRRADWRA